MRARATDLSFHALRVVAAGALVVVLLVIAALGTPSSLARVRGSSVPVDARMPDSVAIATVAVMLLAACGVLHVLITQRAREAPDRRNEAPRASVAVRLVAAAVPLFIVGTFVFVGLHAKRPPVPARDAARQQIGARARHPPPSAARARVHGPSIWPPIVALALTAAVGGAVYVIVLRRSRPDRPLADRRPRTRPSGNLNPVDPARVAEPRAAVIAAFARLEAELEAIGLPRRDGDGPLEFTARVVVQRPALARPVGRLADLYAPARFSEHPVDESMRRDALVALDAVRTALATTRVT